MALTQVTTEGIKDGTIIGTDLATNIDLVDNQTIRLGTGNDLQIFHNGTDSFIQNYSGDFNIRGVDGKWILIQAKPNENSIICKEDGAVELYHDNSKKFETTSYGNASAGQVRVTSSNATTVAFSAGDVGTGFYNTGSNTIGYSANGTQTANIDSAGNYRFFDNVKAVFGTDNDLQIFHDGSHSYIDNTTGTLHIRDDSVIHFASTTNEDLAKFTVNGSVELYHDNSKKFETTSIGATVFGRLDTQGLFTGDNNKILVGNSDDLQIYHDGTYNRFESGATTVLFRSNLIEFGDNSGNKYIKCIDGAATELYHNGSKKFETLSDGVDVTGTLKVNGSALSAGGTRNLIINGAMQVAQRGTSEASVSSTKYANAPDRWRFIASNAGTWTLSQSTTSPNLFKNSYKLDCTTADSSLGAADFLAFDQALEGVDLQGLGWGTSDATSLTVSFHVRSNKTGTYTCELFQGDGATGGSNIFVSKSYTISSADTWEKKTITFSGNTAVAFTNDNSRQLTLNFWLGAGSNFSGGTFSDGTFHNAANRRVASGQVNLADNTSNEWYITGVRLELGSTATDFEHRSFAEEALLCKRYFQIIKGNSDLVMFGSGRASGTSNALVPVQLAVPLRASPTISSTNYSGWGTSGAHTASSTTPSVQSFNDTDNQLNMNFGSLGGALSNGRVATVSCNNGSDLKMDSEL